MFVHRIDETKYSYFIKWFIWFLGNIVVSIKLLNINGYAKNILQYRGMSVNYFLNLQLSSTHPSIYLCTGPLLDSNSDIFKVELVKSKDKQILMNTMMDVLLMMFPSTNFVRTDVDTNLGFKIGKIIYF